MENKKVKKEVKKVSIMDTKTKTKELTRKVGSFEAKKIGFNELMAYLNKLESRYTIPSEIEEDINTRITNIMLPSIQEEDVEQLYKKYTALYKEDKASLIEDLKDAIREVKEGILEAIAMRCELVIENSLTLEEIEGIVKDYITRNVDPACFYTQEEGRKNTLYSKIFECKHLAIKGGLALLLKSKGKFTLKYNNASIKADAEKTASLIIDWTKNKDIHILKWVSNGRAVIPAKIEVIDKDGSISIVEIIPVLNKKWVQVKKPAVDRRKNGSLLDKAKFEAKYLA